MIRLLVITLASAAVLFTPTSAAQNSNVQAPTKQDAAESLPKDTAVLEIDVPPGTKVFIDGEEAKKLRWTYQPLKLGQRVEVVVSARFSDGAETRRKVFLKGGWHVLVPLSSPSRTRPELVLQTGHTGPALALAFSPDGKHLLSGGASTDHTAIVWDVATGRKVRALQGLTSGVTAVDFNSDGTRALTGESEQKVTVWNPTTGERLSHFKGSGRNASFSRDGTKIVGTGQGEFDFKILAPQAQVTILDAATGRKLRTFTHPADPKVAVTGALAAISPDGARVLSATEHQRVPILWEAQSGRVLRTLQGHSGRISSVVFSASGRHALTGANDGSAILWDAATGQKVRDFQGHKGGFTTVYARFVDETKAVTAGGLDASVVLWDLATGQKLNSFAQGDIITALAVHPAGEQIATGSMHGAVTLWNLATGQKVRVLQSHSAAVTTVALSRDGTHIASASNAGGKTRLAAVWQPQTGRLLRTLQGHSEYLSSAALSPDGKLVVTGSADKTAILWDVATGKKLHTLVHTNAPFRLGFSADGTKVLAGSRGTTVWDAATGQKIHHLEAFTGSFSDDGAKVVTVTNTALGLWDVNTAQKLRAFEYRDTTLDRPFPYSSAALSSDGKYVIGGVSRLYPEEPMAIVWDTGTGKTASILKDTAAAPAVALSADGKEALIGHYDGRVSHWDTQSGRKLRTLVGHNADVQKVLFTPDGRKAISGSLDGTVRIWDLATGAELTQLIHSQDGQNWLTVTPDGLFDGSEAGREGVYYRVGGGLNLVPVARFFQDFYRPGLLAALWRGDRPVPSQELGKSQPPSVRIVSPKDGVSEQTRVEVEVSATDQGGGVQGPWLYHQGARLPQSGSSEKDGKTIRRKFLVDLVSGRNVLEAQAASADGSWESEPARITLTYNQALPKGVLYLVAVGVSDYAEGSYKLKFARSDAEAVGKLFKRRGQALYRDVHVTTLVDDGATKSKIRQTMEEIAGKTQAQDTLILFLAGHGTMVGQRYFFIPQDFRITAGRPREDDIREQAIGADVLAEFFLQGQARRRILVLDTCGSGGAVDLFQLAARNNVAFDRDIERLARSQGLYMIAASAATEEAQENRELGHGVLTYALLAGLRAVEKGPLERIWVQSGGPDQVVDVLEWFSFAEGHVRRLGRHQHVHMAGRGSSFPILPLVEP